MKVRILLTCLLLPFAGASAAEPATTPKPMTTTDGPEGTVIVRDMQIATVGDGMPLLVDLAYPKTASAPMPVVLCVHGGGWSGGTKESALRVDLATKGYFVASVAYRLAGKSLWPAQIKDCKLALRWLRANASKYNINPDKIGAWGHSAGGHLVSCLGTMGDISSLDADGPFQGFSSKVQAVADYSGPTDLEVYFKHNPPANLFGPQGKVHPEVMKDASPINFVKSDEPPFFIAHGDQDKLVPIAQATTFADALKQAGVPVQLVILKNAGHSLGGAKTDPPCTPTSDQLRAMSTAFFDKYLKQ